MIKYFQWMVLAALITYPAWGKTRLQNDNNYDVFVALGFYYEGVMSLTGGQHGADTFESGGWYKIPANRSYSFDKNPTHLFIIAHDFDGNAIIIRTTKNNVGTRQFHCVMNSTFSKSQKLHNHNQVQQPRETFFQLSTGTDYLGNSNDVRTYRIPKRNYPDAKRVLDLVHLQNNSGSKISYQFRWNPAENWSSASVDPGHGSLHSTGITSPKPEVRFDGSTETGFQEKKFNLQTRSLRYRASDDGSLNYNDARKYRFEISNYQVLLFDN